MTDNVVLAVVRTTNSIVKFDSSASSRIVHRLENFIGYGPSKKPNAVKKKKQTNKQKDLYGIRSAGMLLIAGTANGERERGTENRERGTGVWELMYSGNPLENSKWRTKQKKRLEETICVNGSFYRLCPQMVSTFL